MTRRGVLCTHLPGGGHLLPSYLESSEVVTTAIKSLIKGEYM